MTSATDPKTILLKGQPIAKEAPLDVGVDITPGMLLDRTSLGEVKPHASAAGYAQPLFARENEVIGNGIDVDYDNDGDNVLFYYCRQGDEVYTFIDAAENITKGDYLESSGDGSLKVYGSGVRIARALESVNNSAGVVHARIKAEVL